MNSIRKAVFASLVATGMGVVTVPAVAIGLAPVLVGITTTEIDEIKIDAVGFDLAASGIAANPGAWFTPSATLAWEQGSSDATSKLTGSMYIDGQSNNCVRVELISYDANSNEMFPGARKHSTEECASDAGYYEFPITDSAGNPYLQGYPGATEVKVRLQTALKVPVEDRLWGKAGVNELEVYGPTLSTSEVLISASKFDFGKGAFAGGTYPIPATVTWSVDGANLIKASTVGSLAMKNASNSCGRIRYTYLNRSPFVGLPDTVLGTQYGNTHCVATDLLQEFAINANSGTAANAFSYAALDKVEIAIEQSSRDPFSDPLDNISIGNWGTVVGSMPVTILLPSAP